MRCYYYAYFTDEKELRFRKVTKSNTAPGEEGVCGQDNYDDS